jgi:hypothetical protein
MRIGSDLRDALKDRALEVQLQHYTEDPSESWIDSDRKIQRQHLAALQ